MGHAKKATMQVGLFNIPIKLEVAVDDESSGYRTVCTGADKKKHDPTRVKMHVDCPTCATSHSSVWGFPERAAERDGQLVMVTAEEIKAASGEPIKLMSLAFHPREKVYAATVAGDSVQNAYPDKGGEKGYAALRDALLAHPEVVAVTVWAPSTKNALWVLEVVDHRIVVSKRAWPEDVRPAPAIAPAEVTELEAQMLEQFVTGTVADFDLAEYRDAARVGMAQLLATKQGVAVTESASQTPAAPASDMLAALQASLDAVKKPAKKAAAPRKKTTAKPAKKLPAKKAAPARKKVNAA